LNSTWSTVRERNEADTALLRAASGGVPEMPASSWDALQQGACDLWRFRPSFIAGSTLERGLAFLSAEERARYARYLVPNAARSFLAARVFLRSVLSEYAPLAPAAWRFDTNPWGRPYTTNPDAPHGLVFNLSHKPGFVTCLVGCARDLGVDVEENCERPYLLQIASRFFSPSESTALLALPATRRLRRFFELWTLKEAYIKARGMGLSLGLSRFSFSVEEAPSPSTATVCFDPGFDDDPRTWDFRLFQPDDHHLIATAVRRSSAPLTIQIGNAENLVARWVSTLNAAQ
jgi:4'-phosphopantetheinyl transferase